MRKLVFVIPILILCGCINKNPEKQQPIDTVGISANDTFYPEELDSQKITPELFYINESNYGGLHPRNDAVTRLKAMGFKKNDSARINLSWEYEAPSLMCDCVVYELNQYKVTALRLLYSEDNTRNPVRYEILFPTSRDKEEFIERGKKIGLNREDDIFEGYYFYGQNGTYMAESNDTVFIGFFH